MMLQYEIFNQFVDLNDVSISDNLSIMGLVDVVDAHGSSNSFYLDDIDKEADEVKIQIPSTKGKRK